MDSTRRHLVVSGAALAALSPLLVPARARAHHTAGSDDTPGLSDPQGVLAAAPGMRMDGSEQVALLLYPGLTALDLVGPHYMLASMLGATVHLVAGDASAPVPSDLGLAIQPTTDFAGCPADLDVLLVPGGTKGTLAAMADAATIGFVADRAARAQWVTSVCTGSLILGQAGLLRGRRATSHWAVRDVLSSFGAVPVDARVVADGRVVTGAGVSAGLDLGLALVARLRGAGYAEAVRLQAEYAPQPPVPGGTPATTDPAIVAMMTDLFAPFAEAAGAAATDPRR